MREDDKVLIDFCRQQYREFKVDDWISLSHISEQLKVAALFLKGTTWYKRDQELGMVCQQWGLELKQLPVLVKQYRFDCARFSGMLKKQIQFDGQGFKL
jgi:predicted nucleic acid-binding Zn ribbon protein